MPLTQEDIDTVREIVRAEASPEVLIFTEESKVDKGGINAAVGQSDLIVIHSAGR